MPRPADTCHSRRAARHVRQITPGGKVAAPQSGQRWKTSSPRWQPSQNGFVSLLGDGAGTAVGCGRRSMSDLPEQEHIGEKDGAAAVRSQCDLRVGKLAGRADSLELMDRADYPLSTLNASASVAVRE